MISMSSGSDLIGDFVEIQKKKSKLPPKVAHILSSLESISKVTRVNFVNNNIDNVSDK